LVLTWLEERAGGQCVPPPVQRQTGTDLLPAVDVLNRGPTRRFSRGRRTGPCLTSRRGGPEDRIATQWRPRPPR